MNQAYVVTGSLDGRTITLDESLPVASGTVRVVVEVAARKQLMDPIEFETWLRERQKARGHVPRTKDEIDAYLHEERASWDK